MYLRFLGQTPSNPIIVTLANQEALRAATEAAYFALSPADRPNWQSILEIPPPVIAGAWFQDPTTGIWYRGNGPFNVAYETLPPVIAGQGTTTILTDAEAAAWIARVEASRQPFYGSPLTIPSRMGWTEPLTIEEISAWANALSWPNEVVQKFFESFATREEAQAWLAAAAANPAMWQAKAAELFPAPPPVATPAPPPPIDYAPPPAAPPPPDTSRNIAPPGTTPPGHRYPILPYAPHPGTPMLIQSGWTSEEIGFWFANAFGGDLPLTEAFLLSFSGREELGAWIVGKSPADVYARADAALAARRARAPAPPPGISPPPPGYEYPPEAGGFGISLPMLALAGAALFYMTRK